ncbi:hypothetical protein Tco_1318760, partial [Tanacetum coccineum]
MVPSLISNLAVSNHTTTAIAIGTCLGVVLLAVGLAAAASWYYCRKPKDRFYDVPVHHNVLPLRGFYSTPTKQLMEYPFMENESVMRCLK